jgi:DNA-binding CsgD family transcriptional regulator
MTKKKPSTAGKRRGGRTEEAARILAARRRELIRLRAEGYALAEIAQQLGCHRNTINNDVRAIERESIEHAHRDIEKVVIREVRQLETARTESWRSFFERANEHGETQQPAYLQIVLAASKRLARLLRLNDSPPDGTGMSTRQRPKVIEVTVRTREQVDLISKGRNAFAEPDLLRSRTS